MRRHDWKQKQNELIDKELEKRIEKAEKMGYEFDPSLTKKDILELLKEIGV